MKKPPSSSAVGFAAVTMVQGAHANLLGSHETPSKASSRLWLAKVAFVPVHV